MGRSLSSFPLILLLMSVCWHSSCNGQERLTLAELKARSGFIVPHHGYMSYFIADNVNALQLNVGYQTNGSRYWHRAYNYPVVGIGLHRSGLGNDTLYGSLTGVYFYINRPFLDIGDRFNIGNILSLGLGFASKWHDLHRYRENMVLGTSINVFFQYEVEASYRFMDNHSLSLGLGFAHASNGSVREPNLGFNILTTSVGYRYLFNPSAPVSKDAVPDETPLSLWNLGFWGSIKSIDAFNPKQYGVAGITAEKLYRIAPLSMIGIELSAYYDASISDMIADNSDTNAGRRTRNNLAVTANATYLMGFGRLCIAFQPGVYLRNKFFGLGSVSNKLGVRYSFFSSFAIFVAIKAHWIAQADFIELGLKYSLIRNDKR